MISTEVAAKFAAKAAVTAQRKAREAAEEAADTRMKAAIAAGLAEAAAAAFAYSPGAETKKTAIEARAVAEKARKNAEIAERRAAKAKELAEVKAKKSEEAAAAEAAERLPPGDLPPPGLAEHLQKYKEENKIFGNGQIAAHIFASRLVRESGLPIDVEASYLTEGGGQISRLGKQGVQKILKDYSIDRVLSEEGGRTNRGSLGDFGVFFTFLNHLYAQKHFDPSTVEAWWVQQARLFWEGKPFSLHFGNGTALRIVIRDLLAQAEKRQKEGGGKKYVGAMLQHLIGAKLALVLPELEIVHHHSSTADAPGGRTGDFELGNSSIHVTTLPNEALIRKCQVDIHEGRSPIIVTLQKSIATADLHAAELGIEDQLEVFDAEQFIVTNLHEIGKFTTSEKRISVKALIKKYNEIVEEYEKDPSLRIAGE